MSSLTLPESPSPELRPAPGAALASWMALQRQGAPMAVQVEALLRAFATQGGIRQAYYLVWHAGSQTYRPVGERHLPPGQGDPLDASDLALHARLQQVPRLDMAAVRALPCWLAGRLRRAGLRHGMALALSLEPGVPGLLLLELAAGERTDWLLWMHDALLCLAPPATPQPLPPLLAADPRPSLRLTADALVQAANPAFLALLGDAPLDAATQFLPVNHAQIVRASLQQGRAIESLEVRVGERLLLWSFIPDPASGCVLARGRDATDTLRVVREATRAQRLYRLITENTTDLISRHDPDGRFLDASPASWTLLGYWPEQLRGRYLLELCLPEEAGPLFALQQEALTQDGYHTMTYRIRHQQGHWLWFETASRAIRDTYTGAAVEIVSVSRDITARVQAEANKRRLEDELAHTVRLATLGELASGIAHEINQPLAAVVNYASACQRYLREIARQPQAEARLAQGLARVAEHATHAAAVIRRLRTFLRKDQRRVQPLDVAGVAREAVHLCAWEAQQHQVTITTDLSDNLPPVYADPVLLQQVLLNLLRNAIDANRERHPAQASQIHLEAQVPLDGNQLCVLVRDQGPGLSPEAREKVFAPFYTSKPAGLGLGLSMSRNIIEGFGGELDIVSNSTDGLVMGCSLPLRAATPAR